MDRKKTGVCPVRSDQILDFALNALIENGALAALPEEALWREAEALKKILPDHSGRKELSGGHAILR